MYIHIYMHRLTCLDIDCRAHSQNALNTSANIRSKYAVIVIVNANVSVDTNSKEGRNPQEKVFMYMHTRVVCKHVQVLMQLVWAMNSYIMFWSCVLE